MILFDMISTFLVELHLDDDLEVLLVVGALANLFEIKLPGHWRTHL